MLIRIKPRWLRRLAAIVTLVTLGPLVLIEARITRGKEYMPLLFSVMRNDFLRVWRA